MTGGTGTIFTDETDAALFVKNTGTWTLRQQDTTDTALADAGLMAFKAPPPAPTLAKQAEILRMASVRKSFNVMGGRYMGKLTAGQKIRRPTATGSCPRPAMESFRFRPSIERAR